MDFMKIILEISVMEFYKERFFLFFLIVDFIDGIVFVWDVIEFIF